MNDISPSIPFGDAAAPGSIIGAENMVRTLVAGGVDVCFANPGTSEMHFVAALDRTEGMRCVLALFEGVATGAADGYGRMMGTPAATLLHLGPGLANGLANLHNARKARTPILNIVGDHATHHRQYESPMRSDVEAVAAPFSDWQRSVQDAASAAGDVADGIAEARRPPGQVATLILPANAAWDRTAASTPPPKRHGARAIEERDIAAAVAALRAGARTGIVLGGLALRGRGLEMAGRIAAKTGARLLSTYNLPRIERGAGRVVIAPIPYAVDLAVAFLKDFDNLVLLGGEKPVAFFAYPGKPSLPSAPGCQLHTLAAPDQDILQALDWLADATGARSAGLVVAPLELPALATGTPTPMAIAQSVAALMPEGAILVDESCSSGFGFPALTRTARPHDSLKNVGGAIGFGLPAAIGAAIACPDRKVICLEADGSGMFTLQALWTQARERLAITNIIFANRTYATLASELTKVGVPSPGPRARDMLEIGRPDLDWCLMARGMGVEAHRATDMQTFNRLLADALRSDGPVLIEVML